MSVALVGAGPGDPELITVRGLARLRACEVLVYDRLVGDELVDEAPADALRIARDDFRQEDVNRLLVMHGRNGRRGLRLHDHAGRRGLRVLPPSTPGPPSPQDRGSGQRRDEDRGGGGREEAEAVRAPAPSPDGLPEVGRLLPAEDLIEGQIEEAVLEFARISHGRFSFPRNPAGRRATGGKAS